MKFTVIAGAIAAASLGFSAGAFAQGHDRPDVRHAPPQVHKKPPHQMDQRHPKPPMHRADPRDQRGFDEPEMRRNDRRDIYNARGPEFKRGARIHNEFRSRQYQVSDYREHRLKPPPRGQQWVQVGTDYVLIAIATGLITQIILGQ